MSRPFTAVAAAALLVLPCALQLDGTARAQSPEQKATAEVAFQKGVKLMEEGSYAKACALLEESQQLDPQMGTEYQIAQCYEKSGRLASAWARYRSVADAARAAKMPDRQSWAEERAKALEPRLSTVTIVVPPAVASTEGLTVERNGVAVGRGLWGEATFVDGGGQRVSANAPGRRAWSTEIVAAPEGAKLRVEVPPLQPSGVGGPPAGPATPAGGAVAPPADGAGGVTAADESVGDGSAQVAAGVVVAAVGLASLGAGVVVGVLAKSSYDSSGEEHCTDLGCDQQGVDEAEIARARGDIATVLFVVGGAALVGGVVTWLTAPSGDADPGSAETAGLSVDVAPRWQGAVLQLGGRL